MTATERDQSCRCRITAHLRGRIDDLRRSWRAYRLGRDCKSFPEYGLSFDYVPAGTFNDQRQGYFRYQLSWGGPSDEFRFFTDAELCCYRIEYWFLDWFDGAHCVLSGSRKKLLLELRDWFRETGAAKSARRKSA